MCGPMSDLVFASLEKVWSYMTPNVLTETGCHETTQINQTNLYSKIRLCLPYYKPSLSLRFIGLVDLRFRHNPIWMCMCKWNSSVRLQFMCFFYFSSAASLARSNILPHLSIVR